MAFFAGLITILALSAAEPAPQDAPGVAAPACAEAGIPARDGLHASPRFTSPDDDPSPFTPSDPLRPFSEGEDDNLGEDLIDYGAIPFDCYPSRDDGAASRNLSAIIDQDPAAGRIMPRRC